MEALRSARPIRPAVVGGAVAAGGVVVLLTSDLAVPGLTLLGIGAWIIVAGVLDATVVLTDAGVSFVTLGGRQLWPWTEITEAHLSGTGTVPGIAVYRGRSQLRLVERQFPDLGVAARLIEEHVRPEVVRSAWEAPPRGTDGP